MHYLNYAILALTLSSSYSQAQEYIGMKTTSKGDCRLYRERFVVDSRKFADDLKKQVAYREKLIGMGKEKVANLATSHVSTEIDQSEKETKRNKKSQFDSIYNSKTKISSHAMVAVEQVEDDVQGSDLLWTFEYCVYDKPVNQDTQVLGTTGVAQKVFGNPDDTYTIESPRVLHAGQIYHLESPFYANGDYNFLGVPEEKILLKNLCKRFGFKKYVSHTGGVQTQPTVRFNKFATVVSIDGSGHQRNVLKQLTCK